VVQDRDVVGKNLAKQFVDLSGWILRGERFPELLLDRGERGLDVPPLWIFFVGISPPAR
jgi:hypothetical protein